jgi:hypothetical protein
MAIIGIILGAFGFLCSPLAIIPYYMPMPQPNPVIDAVKNDSVLFGSMIAGIAMGWVLAAFLLIGSVGALGLRDWARQVLIGWAITNILLAIVQTTINLIWFFPKMQQITRSAGGPAAGAAAAGGMIGLVFGLLFGVGVPAVMIYIMTRPQVKDAFARGLKPVI